MEQEDRGHHPVHIPVMVGEVLEALSVERGGLFVDATLGLGGHTEAILRSGPETRVIGLDRDAEALEMARARLEGFGGRFTGVHSDYRRLGEVLDSLGAGPVDGVLADLGVSSLQFDDPGRGFSFRSSDAPLDMRMDRSEGPTAADLLNGLAERELADLIWRYGEEPAARRIARRIVEARRRKRLETTGELAELVLRAAQVKGRWRIHPATRTFQALRIAVNRELEGLDGFIDEAVTRLAPGGRLVVITFHSLEDRIVKQALRYQSGHCVCPPTQPVCACGAIRRIEILTRKVVVPGDDEVEANPRARSAKLRAGVRLAPES